MILKEGDILIEKDKEDTKDGYFIVVEVYDNDPKSIHQALIRFIGNNSDHWHSMDYQYDEIDYTFKKAQND